MDSPPVADPRARRATSLPLRSTFAVTPEIIKNLPRPPTLPESQDLTKTFSSTSVYLTSLFHPPKRRLRTNARPWTQEEDEELRETCLQSNNHNWSDIAATKFPLRTPRSVETRWNKELKVKCGLPVIKRKPWDGAHFQLGTKIDHDENEGKDELETLSDGEQERPSDLTSRPLSDETPSVNVHNPLARRWNAGRCEWTQLEDARLQELCLGSARHCWQELAKLFVGRSARSTETRWNKVIKPRLMKQELELRIEQLGDHVNGDPSPRTNPQDDGPSLQSILRRQLVRWTNEEDDLLRELVTAPRQSRVKWSEIALKFPGRTKSGVQSRWQGILAARLKAATQSNCDSSATTSPSSHKRSLSPATTDDSQENYDQIYKRSRLSVSPASTYHFSQSPVEEEHIVEEEDEPQPRSPRRATLDVMSVSFLTWRNGK